MPEALIRKRKREHEQEIVLRLLQSVAFDERVSQASFATQVGIAKGLANAYFNRCLQKGWIKLRHVPRQRYLYYLTPKGMVEKVRLTADFLSSSYQFYRHARTDLLATLSLAGKDGCVRIGVLGVGELAEIAAIVAHAAPVELVGFVASGEQACDLFVDLPVAQEWRQLPNADAALLATLDDPDHVFKGFRADNPGVPIYVPDSIKPLIGL